MIDNISANQKANLLGSPLLQSSDAAKSRPSNDLDATLQINFGDLIETAKQPQTDEAQSVELARQLLLSGDLTNPQNVRSAAESILTFGI